MPELSPRPIPVPSSRTSSRDEKPSLDELFCSGMEASAQVMVALDLGTTFSGFAYAHRLNPSDIHTLHDWPSQTEAAAATRYCKTQTSLFYRYSSASSSFTLQAWGWPAFVSYQKALRMSRRPGLAAGTSSTLHLGTSSQPTFSHVCNDKITCADMLPGGSAFISCFKLYLAHQAGAPYASQWSCVPLPTGLDIDRLVTDYLRALSEFVFEHLRDKYGTQLQKRDIQWCITVPAIWAEQAKQKMKQCAQNAGLSKGILDSSETEQSSCHPLRIVLEPEAASLHCLHRARYSSIKEGDRFAVVDVGGATIDIVVHEKLVNRFQVKEIAKSAGCLSGGVFVDEHYLKILASKVSCVPIFLKENPYYKMKLLRQWQSVKASFDGQITQIVIDLPSELAAAQAKQDEAEGVDRDEDSGEVIFTHEDLCKILDPEVDKVIDLLEQQMKYNIEAILLVGGFSASPYLLKTVRQAFRARVKTIISPPNPGSTICQGAVLFSMSKEPITCRVSRKTYGIKCTKDFVKGLDPDDALVFSDDGDEDCEDAFAIFVRVGDTVLFDQIEEHIFYPTCRKQKSLCLELYSSTELDPCFVTEEGCVKEGEIEVDISEDLRKDKRREICVSMRFGTSLIEMSAKGINFGSKHNLGMLPVSFQHAMDVIA